MQKLVSGYNIGLRNTTGTNSADTAYSDQLQKKKNNNYWSCIISMTWPDTDIFITHWVFKALELKLHNFNVNHWFIKTEHLRVCVCDFLTSQCVLPRCSQRSSLVPGHRHTGPQSGMQPTWWERDTHACHVWLSLRPTAVESHCCSWMADCFISF